MKKGRFKKRLKVGFWLVFALGCLWLALVPPMASHKPPSGVTVKVHQNQHAMVEEAAPTPSVETPLPSTGGEEQTMSPNVTIPVVPETESRLPPGQQPRIAILIDDVGPNLRESQRAIKLPSAVTLAFLPYAVRVREQAREAREAGHELMLHMPMEPVGREDPGPGALLTELPMRDLQQRFDVALSSFTGFDGINNHMGSKFTVWPEGMEMVMTALADRGLFFLDSRTSGQSIGKAMAEKMGVPTVARDVFLDGDQSPAAIRAQLTVLERVARRKGHAVAIGHPHVTTLAVLETWMAEAQQRGFVFVPVNALVKK